MSKNSKESNAIRVVADRTVIARKLGVTPRFVGYILTGERTTPRQVKRVNAILDKAKADLGLPPWTPVE